MRFGLFGTGPWACDVHAPALADHPDGELVGVWGRDPARARAIADRHGTRPYRDADALLAAADAAAIALPPAVQPEVALRAAAAGRHLLLEKPLALTVEAADRIRAAVRENRVASLVFFTNRFYPNIDGFLRELAGTGEWGGARVTRFAANFQPGSRFDSPWRRRHGGLWDIGPHALSLLLPVLGPVVRVAAMDGPRGTCHVLLSHRGGATSTLSLTSDAPPAATVRECVFHGAAGLATVPAADGRSVDALRAAATTLAHLAAAGVRDHPCDVDFGREVVAVLAAADTARSTGSVVPVPGPDAPGDAARTPSDRSTVDA